MDYTNREPIPENIIEERFKKIDKMAADWGYLDNEVLKIQEYINGERKKAKLPEIKINFVASEYMQEGNGWTQLTDETIIIYYPKDIAPLKKRVFIAHELGHLALHTQYVEKPFVTQKIEGAQIEKEASYFAYLLLNKRREWYTGAEFKGNYQMTEAELKKAINEIL